MIIEILYSARCKDCQHIKRYTIGKRVRHKCLECSNQILSGKEYYNVRLRDLACDNFKLIHS